MISILMLAAVVTMAGPLDGRVRCERGAPEPRSFHARGMGFVAEVFPPLSRHNPTERPRVLAYRVGYPGTEWRVDAERAWTVQLPHDRFPAAAVASPAGHLVTLDDYDTVGTDHAVVIVSDAGHVLADHSLSDLFSDAEIAGFPLSSCGIHWREDAEFYFILEAEPAFYVVLPGDAALRFDLSTGELERGAAGDFSRLAAVRSQPFANERVEIWATSLRFASISDWIDER